VNANGKEHNIATVMGSVERVNKLIMVRPLSNRYTPEIGDVVVGRVTDVVDKRWRIDLNARQSGSLLLSSVNLPGGQRRRTDEDSLQMRAFLSENDLVSAEVQKIGADRSASIHTRSHRYGKLEYGSMVSVPAYLIKRCKHHFHALPDLNLDLIIGVNGFIWIAPMLSEEQKKKKMKENEDDSLTEKEGGGTHSTMSATTSTFDTAHVTEDMREALARVRNSIQLLVHARKQIYKESILHVYNESVTMNLPCSDMLLPKNLLKLTQHANMQ
jgi:exosome complex component RRP4